ncbi:hypothetical protein [Rhodoferax sp.]|uniref:hypothetical protein n=1 Tax=Rhodoferax sp. TaxID=50421 RepID=UPI00261A3558|nr:hypothetical protein [Rhodoferax sp.]MDD2918550.1 hypothetical protein [Rhodoferax sp.]
MKTFFSLVSFVVGILVLLIGFGNLLFLTHNPANAAAGGVVTVVGLTFLWLATEAMFSRANQG